MFLVKVKTYIHEITIGLAILVNIAVSFGGFLGTSYGIWANALALSTILWAFAGIRMKSVANHHIGSAIIVALITSAFAVYVIPGAPGLFHTSVLGLALGFAFFSQLFTNSISGEALPIRFISGPLMYIFGLSISLLVLDIDPMAKNPGALTIAIAALIFFGLSLMPEKSSRKKERCKCHISKIETERYSA